MKTSKIILFSYIGLLFLAATGFVIYGVTTDYTPRVKPQTVLKTIKADIKPYKYINTTRQNIDIKTDTANYLSIRLPEESHVNNIDFKVSNDTLYLTRTHKYYYVTIHTTPKSVINVTSNSAYTSFYNINADTLNYNGENNSKINNFYDNTSIKALNITLEKSKLRANNGSFDELRLNSTDSYVYIKHKINNVEGQIKHKSEVQLRGSKRIDLAMDESSKLYCRP